MHAPHRHESRTRARTASTVVALAVFVLSLGELATWLVGGAATERLPVWLATVALAVLAGALAGFVAWFGGVFAGIALVLTPIATWFLRRWLVVDLIPPDHVSAWVGAAAAAIGLNIALARTAGSKLVVPSLSCLAVALGLATAMRLPHLDPPRSEPPPASRDVLWLVLDTTRQDAMSGYGNPRPTSPHLDRFARRSRTYANAWSASPWTPPSHASMFTGLLPAEHGVEGSARPEFPDHVPTIAASLRRAGYATAGFFANALLDARGWSRGFDEYRPPWISGRHTLTIFLNKRLYGGIGARVRIDAARATLRLGESWWNTHGDTPRFLFVNLIDSHSPYRPERNDRRRFLPGVTEEQAYAVSQDARRYYLEGAPSRTEADVLRRLYDAEIADMDREIGRFLQHLDALGALDDAVVLVTSDHGERFGEYGALGHLLTMDPYLLRVPLVVREPNAPPEVVDHLVSTRDLAAWIASLARTGISWRVPSEPSADEAPPTVVAQMRENEWVLNQLQARDPAFDTAPYRGDRVFVTDGEYAYCGSAGLDERGSLVRTTDPNGARDLQTVLPEVAARLQRIASELPSFVQVAPTDMDPDARDRLRALGYAD